MREILYGLEVAEYRHPADLAAQNAVEKATLVNKLGQALENFENIYQDQILFLGNRVRLTPENAPRIWGLLEQAKDILDYRGEIQLFTGRDYSFRIEAGGGPKPLIMVSDAVLRQFSDSWLLFLLGQGVTMIKGRMLKLFQLSRGFSLLVSAIPLAGDALKVPLGQWLRKAQLTIDRGGLLACQDENVAMQYLTVLAGVPLKDVDTIDLDARMEQIQRAGYERKDFVESFGHLSATVFSERRAWANERFLELYLWCVSGAYGKVIQAHT